MIEADLEKEFHTQVREGDGYGCVNIPVLVATATLMGSPTVTLDNWEGNKDRAQLSGSNKTCLKMAFWPPAMGCQATNDPSKGQASKGGDAVSSRDFGSACEGGWSLLEMVLTMVFGSWLGS